MEHIVQFAVGVDDDRIRQLCEENAAKQIVDDVMRFSHGTISSYSSTLNEEPNKLCNLFIDEIDKFIKEHADEILEKAIETVAKNMTKTKKFKEATDKLVGEIQ